MKLEEWERELQQLSDQNLLDMEGAKEQGRKVIGFYCLYAPVELAVAAGAIPVSLCGTRHEPIPLAERVLPRNLCPLIKSSFGFAAGDTCPYFRFSDLVVGETTCDGKKKMFEFLAEYRPMHVLQLPQQQEGEALSFWKGELTRFKEKVETVTGTEITPERLSSAIRLLNEERAARKALMDLGRMDPPPISGMELVHILFRVGFFIDKKKGISVIETLVEAFRERGRKGEGTVSLEAPRILLTGVPVGLGSHKVIQLIERAGAVVTALENCSGYRGIQPVDEEKEPFSALAEKTLMTPCSVMSPNPGRLKMLEEMIVDFSIQGVVDLTWQACHTYNVESRRIETFVEERFGIPFLHLETDYSESDTEQLAVRIEAFLEVVREERARFNVENRKVGHTKGWAGDTVLYGGKDPAFERRDSLSSRLPSKHNRRPFGLRS